MKSTLFNIEQTVSTCCMHYVFHRRSVSRQAGNIQKMLMLQELQTRILNIRYVLKHPNLSEVQRVRFLQLLGSAETELLEIYKSGHL